jgi:hypothetical protein
MPQQRAKTPLLTPRVIGLFRRLECMTEFEREHWEEDRKRGRRREFLDGNMELARRLGLDPFFDFTPVDCTTFCYPSTPDFEEHRRSFERAQHLRGLLLAASGLSD